MTALGALLSGLGAVAAVLVTGLNGRRAQGKAKAAEASQDDCPDGLRLHQSGRPHYLTVRGIP